MRKQSGFTLVEIMIVVAIIGILAAVALPAYSRYVQNTNRAIAQTDLIELSQQVERFYTANSTYTSAAIGFSASPRDSQSPAYQLTLTVVGGTSYTLTAAPQGNQGDDGCGSLTLNQVGAKGVSGASKTTAECW